jgi:hypothetical protein
MLVQGSSVEMPLTLQSRGIFFCCKKLSTLGGQPAAAINGAYRRPSSPAKKKALTRIKSKKKNDRKKGGKKNDYRCLKRSQAAVAAT